MLCLIFTTERFNVINSYFHQKALYPLRRHAMNFRHILLNSINSFIHRGYRRWEILSHTHILTLFFPHPSKLGFILTIMSERYSNKLSQMSVNPLSFGYFWEIKSWSLVFCLKREFMVFRSKVWNYCATKWLEDSNQKTIMQSLWKRRSSLANIQT